MSAPIDLRAGSGLALRGDAAGGLRVSFRGASDWLGAICAGILTGDGRRRPAALLEATDASGADALGAFAGRALHHDQGDLPLATTVRAYRDRPLVVFRTEARAALAKYATGALAEPRLAWPWLRPTLREPGGAPAGASSFGHQISEFAYPTHGDADFTGFLFVPHRPRLLLPLLLVAPAGTLLLAPLSGFHELVGAVPSGEAEREAGVRIGWHGDLDQAPAGFATELALLAGESPRAVLEEWGALLQQSAGVRRRGRYDDALLAGLSYWTDNGSVYYYRTAPDADYTETLARAVGELGEQGVPIRALQLDSWFYPHEKLRAVSSEGAPVVPPTGMLRWEPREDLFPDGLEPLRERTGFLPLCFHSRHFSARSPYWERHAAWIDGEQAHPQDARLFERLLEQTASWGGVTYEQDWLVESFLGVRGLREAPGRAAAWQRALDAAAARRGVTLQWCMATPADFMESVHLSAIASIRTSGDYRYLFDNALNWVWFLHGNALARALGLWPYKDVFLSHDRTPEGFGDSLGEAEALLAALSGGPVGIGDQIGHTQTELVLRTCRADGVLVKPDLPIAALDRCYRGHGFFGGEPLAGETWSDHPAGRFAYVVTMNASRESKERGEPLRVRIGFDELGAARPAGDVVVYDWRAGTFARAPADGAIEETLAYQEFGYRVLCPVLPGGVALFGDVSKFATMGDRRVAGLALADGGARCEVQGAPGEHVVLSGCAPRPLRGAERWTPASGAEPLETTFDRATGGFRVRVPVGPLGIAGVTLRWE
jgi:hypothetical protein